MSLDPNAPLLRCGDCDDGTVTCRHCSGHGGTETRSYVGNPIWTPCDYCNGQGSKVCRTCDGQGEFPDPEAVLEEEEAA